MKYFKLITLLVLTCITFVQTSSGMRCFTCINAKSNEECNKQGEVVECQPNEESCQNEVRLSENGFGYLITKRCKQAIACENNQNQNRMPAWNQTQCDREFPQNSVCRCCCTGDLCNGVELPCDEVPRCPSRGLLLNGNVICSDNNFANSTCEYSCGNGYRLIGDATVGCYEDEYSYRWSASEPECQPSECFLQLQAPENGEKVCTEGNTVNSQCTFSCKTGYRLVGSSKLTCQKDGEWTSKTPVCERIVCKLSQENPDHGSVRCTDSNFFGSNCQFFCQEGYYLIGNEVITCESDSSWTSRAATCNRIYCGSELVAPSNGNVICSDKNFYSSECQYFCDEGFYMEGSQKTICQADFTWTTEPAICEQIRCEPPAQNPENGKVVCSDGNLYASACAFTCSEGYRMVGFETTTCQENFEWTNRVPYCQQVTCNARRTVLENGQTECSNSNIYGSECSFSCDAGYYLVGEESTSCTYYGWDKRTPVCERHTCGPKPAAPLNGFVKCTEESFSFSQCNFVCGDGTDRWEAKGDLQSTCALDPVSNSFRWNNDAPCCARRCPPYAQVDLFFVLDSSSSVGKENWKKTVNFVADVINDFVISEQDMLVAAIRYNKYVDIASEIKLGDYTDNNSTVDAIRRIPYDGSGTFTGRAIKYVYESMLRHPGNRPTVQDMILIVTDGISKDDVGEPAKFLRATGSNVMALGVMNAKGTLKEKDVLDITGDPEKTVMLPNGFDGLTPELVEKIKKQICGNPCDRVNQYGDFARMSGFTGF